MTALAPDPDDNNFAFFKSPSPTYCPKLEHYLRWSDADSGFKSSAGSMIARAEVGPAAHSDGAYRATFEYGRDGTPYEGKLCKAIRAVYAAGYASELGLRAPNAKGLKREYMRVGGHPIAADAKNDPYNSRQCDYHEQTFFCSARKCWQAWRKLNRFNQKVLLAHYMGLPPLGTQPGELTVPEKYKLEKKYGEFAPVAYWCVEPEVEFDDGVLEMRIVVEAAHVAWREAIT